MTMHVALLRAINLAGKNAVAMADLRALFERLGFPEARTLLQSGNVVFESAGKTTAKLEQLLEKAASGGIGIQTDFFVRSLPEWTEILARNPFPVEARKDPGHLIVLVLKEAPGAADVKAVQKAIRGPEVIRSYGRQAYITYPDGMGRSKLTPAVLEKGLGTRGTARNWNTALKIAAALAASV
jgi:uncharacterized protein (DUF1697 family)